MFTQKMFTQQIFTQKNFHTKKFSHKFFFTESVRLSFVDLRWAQLYVSLVRSMDFDNRKVYGDTFISDGLVFDIYHHSQSKIERWHRWCCSCRHRSTRGEEAVRGFAAFPPWPAPNVWWYIDDSLRTGIANIYAFPLSCSPLSSSAPYERHQEEGSVASWGQSAWVWIGWYPVRSRQSS